MVLRKTIQYSVGSLGNGPVIQPNHDVFQKNARSKKGPSRTACCKEKSELISFLTI